MCGIAGIITLNKKDLVLNEHIEQMTDLLKHRGPNDRGFVLFSNVDKVSVCGNNSTAIESWKSSFLFSPKSQISDNKELSAVALGHCRLSVIDVSAAGHQPMCNQSQDIWVTLNGEIYNYLELKQELENLGCEFVTKSDTEVLIQAYQIWGIDCLEHFNGMWSFVLYDKRKNIIFGSRDRTGVKPFYYYRDNDVFCFASEPKALAFNDLVSTSINTQEVFNLLIMARADYNGNTLFSNIQELAPASYFIINLENSKIEFKSYFSLTANYHNVTFDQIQNQKYINEVKGLVFESVNKRLRADIPIGFCLSGGIDSSSIVCVVDQINKMQHNNMLGSKITAFTAVNNIESSDEAHWAKLVVDQVGINWVKAECTSENMIDLLPEMVYYQDSPLVSTSTYAQYKVMESASNHNIPVLIDGQGGDELFAGYVPFYTSLYLNFIKNGKFKNLHKELTHLSNSPYSMKLFGLTTLKLLTETLTPVSVKNQLFRNSRPEAKYIDYNYWLSNSQDITFSKGFSLKPLNALLEDYYSGYYLKNLLRWEDRCSMRFSIESRTPFSDDLELMNAVFAIPEVYKIHNGWNKSLLRSAMQGVIPESIRLRTDKLGFSTPQNLWLKQAKNQLFEILVSHSDSTSFVDKQLLIKDWNAIFDGNNAKLQNFAFRYVNYLIWQKAFHFTK